jgi:hypothetical protein
LNGKPVFIRGVLDQGYNPDGIYTYPSESRIVADIEAAKSAGFNLVRLHIKVEEPLVLYHADRLGVLIDADVPSWGIFPYTSGYTPQARERWQATMEGMFARDFNHPSVIWWTLFNEDWGLLSSVDFYDRRRQEFVASMVKRARELDGTRLIEDHSTIRNDHVGDTDINSFHIYNSDPAGFGRQVQEWTDNLYPGSTHNCVEGAVQNGAPLINTEYGPFSYEAVPERERNRDISWGFRTLTSEFRKREKIAGYIFTELYDVEFEFNGFTRYDRRTKEFGYPDGITPADVNSADFVDLTVPWMEAWEGAAVVPTQAFVSRWGSDPTSGEMIRAVLVDGTTGAVLAERLVPVDAPRYRTTEAEGMQWSFAALPVGSYYFRLEWLDAEGRTIARNYTPVHILEGLAPKATCEGRKCVIPLNLEGCTGTLDRYSAAVVDGLMMAAGFLGEGRMECPPLIIPETVPLGVPLAVRFTGEMAANVDGAPQTDGTVAEGKASISFNGALLGEVELPPDRADSRGVLSCINGPVPPCGYGNPIRTGTVNIPGLSARTGTVRFEASGDGAKRRDRVRRQDGADRHAPFSRDRVVKKNRAALSDGPMLRKIPAISKSREGQVERELCRVLGRSGRVHGIHLPGDLFSRNVLRLDVVGGYRELGQFYCPGASIAGAAFLVARPDQAGFPYGGAGVHLDSQSVPLLEQVHAVLVRRFEIDRAPRPLFLDCHPIGVLPELDKIHLAGAGVASAAPAAVAGRAAVTASTSAAVLCPAFARARERKRRQNDDRQPKPPHIHLLKIACSVGILWPARDARK